MRINDILVSGSVFSVLSNTGKGKGFENHQMIPKDREIQNVRSFLDLMKKLIQFRETLRVRTFFLYTY